MLYAQLFHTFGSLLPEYLRFAPDRYSRLPRTADWTTIHINAENGWSSSPAVNQSAFVEATRVLRAAGAKADFGQLRLLHRFDRLETIQPSLRIQAKS